MVKNICRKAGITYGRFIDNGMVLHDMRYAFTAEKIFPTTKNPVRGGSLTGSVGGGNEGKEETSFHLPDD